MIPTAGVARAAAPRGGGQEVRLVRRGWAAIAVAVLLLVPAIAAADGDEPRVPSARVLAAGSGTIWVDGRMVVNGSLRSPGTVRIVDRAGDAVARISGAQVRFDRRGRAVVRRAAGILFVAGSRVYVILGGRDLVFAVAGNGRIRFRGRGIYRMNHGPVRTWDDSWLTVAPGAEQGRRRGPARAR